MLLRHTAKWRLRGIHRNLQKKNQKMPWSCWFLLVATGRGYHQDILMKSWCDLLVNLTTFQIGELIHLTQNILSSSHPLSESKFFHRFSKKKSWNLFYWDLLGLLVKWKWGGLERLNQINGKLWGFGFVLTLSIFFGALSTSSPVFQTLGSPRQH